MAHNGISGMLDSIAAGDQEGAMAQFNAIAADKVGAALENMKVDVANEHFNNLASKAEE